MRIEMIVYSSESDQLVRKDTTELLESYEFRSGDVVVYTKRQNADEYLCGHRAGLSAFLARVIRVQRGSLEVVTPAGRVRELGLDDYGFKVVMRPGQHNGCLAPSFTQRVNLAKACSLFREGLPQAPPERPRYVVGAQLSRLDAQLLSDAFPDIGDAAEVTITRDTRPAGAQESSPDARERVAQHAKELLNAYGDLVYPDPVKLADRAFEMAHAFELNRRAFMAEGVTVQLKETSK